MTYQTVESRATLGLYEPLRRDTLFVEVCEYGRNNHKGLTVAQALRDGEYTEWTAEKIKRAFACGMGTQKDLDEFARNNRKYLLMLKV